MYYFTKATLLVLLTIVTTHLFSQESLFAHLYDKQEVTVVLSEEVGTIKKNFEKDQVTEGTIDIVADGTPISLSATFNLGGKTRRKICRKAPVKIDLKKDELEAASFIRDCDKAKIVFQCNDSKSMAAAITMEKTLYDIYDVISQYGRRAKSIKVKDGESSKELTGFLLEDDDDFGIRTGTEVLKNKTIATSVLNRGEYVKMCLFQYMISNADWSARKGHNTDLYRRLEDNSLIVVPYDFDYSGIINNSYAVAPENLPISEVTQRYFMDKKVTIEELKEGVTHYLAKEQDILSSVQNSRDLSDGSKKKMRKFIEGFYKIIRNEKKLKRMIK